jgi:hypothetical protein
MMSFEVFMKYLAPGNSQRSHVQALGRLVRPVGIGAAVFVFCFVSITKADETARLQASLASDDAAIIDRDESLLDSKPGSSFVSKGDELNKAELNKAELKQSEALNDEVWLVSSRQVSCPTVNLTGLKYYRRLENQWVETPAEEFDRTSHHSRLNVFFVHGNRTDFQWASRRGLQAYDSFVASQNPGLPIRYVIWAWPSDQVGGLVTDFRIKAQRANREGHLFGTFLASLPTEERVSLVGYSYGSRIVLGGLQLLSGEKLFGRQLDLPESYAPPEFRVTLIAAATSNGSLTPNATYGHAYPLMDRLLLDRQRRISAMGRGMTGRTLLEDGGERVEQFDFAKEIGHEHSLTGYFCSSRIRNLLKHQVFWTDDDGDATEIVDPGSPSR